MTDGLAGADLAECKTIDSAAFADQPWNELSTVEEVEAWVEQYNRDLQLHIQKRNAAGCGVCFCLRHGGQIFMHTAECAILLDVTPDAEWLVPVLSAATGITAPSGQIWVLPGDVLTQLVLGLNSLIASTRIIASHHYKYQN